MPGRLILQDFLPYRLSVLSNRISRDIALSYQDRFGLTVPEWRVMAILGEAEGLSAREVAARTAMDKVAVSRAVASLCHAGFIARKTDDSDKRRVVLSLTKKGRGVYDKVVPVALSYETAILKQLSKSDRAALDQLLEKLTVIQSDLEI